MLHSSFPLGSSMTPPSTPPPTSSPSSLSWKWVARLLLLLTILLRGIGVSLTSGPFRSDVVNDLSSVYVPGAGFSGFWFTLGRLRSIPNPADRNYHCFSAGCLGVVATLANVTVGDVTDLAFGLQSRYQDGELTRYQLAETFVQNLIPPDMELGREVLDRIHVYTTAYAWSGVATVRRARTTDELRDMLVQTTWIPFATGWGFGKADGSPSGSSAPSSGSAGQDSISRAPVLHMDGGFSMLWHPRCASHLGLPLTMVDLFLNVVNPNLSRAQVDKFLNAGLAYGI